MELVINDETYTFKAGFGFLHEINKTVAVDVDGVKKKKEIGLTYCVLNMLEGDVDALVECLLALNVGQKPRVQKSMLEAYIEEVEDIDKLFDEVIDFLSKANVSKKVVATALKTQEDNQTKDA